MKTALKITRNGDAEDRKAKEQVRAKKKLTNQRIRALQTAQKITPQEKSWVEDGSGKEREKGALRKDKRALHKRKQSY